MSPILQTLITFAIGVLLCLLFLSKMPLAIRHDLPHMIDVVLLILAGVLLGILLENRNNLAARVVTDGLTGAIILGPSL